MENTQENTKFNKITDILGKWLSITNHRKKIRYNYFAGSLLYIIKNNQNDSSDISDTEIYNKFKKEISNLSEFPPEALAAGIGMYMIMSYLSYRVHGEIINKDSIFYICLLYIDLDYIIDSTKNPKKYISSVQKFIESDRKEYKRTGKIKEYTGNDRRFVWYRKIVEENLNLIEHIYNLFVSEAKSYFIQKKTPFVTRSFLKSITKEKSKCTAELLCAILNIFDLNVIQDVVQLGYISQILDDMFDLDEDRRDGIHTLVTFELENSGNIDNLFEELLEKIDNIENKYNEIRIGMFYLALYTISKYKILSREMMLLVEPYILLDHRYNINLKLY